MIKQGMKGTIVLFAADAWEHVCPTIRVIAPAEMVGYEVIPGCSWIDGMAEVSISAIQSADIVVIQRNFPQYRDAYQLVYDTTRSSGKPLIYEIDDLLLDLPPWHKDADYYQKASIPILRAVVDADMVSCSTRCIADSIAFANTNVRVLPNYLVDRLWTQQLQTNVSKPVTVSDKTPVVIGYVGGHSHSPDLDMLKPVFVHLTRLYGSRILFRFWGCEPPIEIREWSNVAWQDPGLIDYAQYAEWLGEQSCDIFLAPLRDCHFNRCKSSLKYLEYSAMGVPGVFSQAGPYAQVISHGKTGFLADNLLDWVSILGTLIDDEGLRHSIGKAAKETVLQNFLLSDHVNLWSDAYDEVTNRVHSGQTKNAPLSAVWYFSDAYLEKTKTLDEYRRETTASIAHQQDKIAQLEQDLLQRNTIIDLITQSSGWRLLAIAGQVRKWFIPPHSLREKVFYTVLSKLSALYQRIKGNPAASKLQDTKSPGDKIVEDGIAFEVVPGSIKEVPNLSIIVTDDASTAGIDVDATYLWASGQTYTAYEIIHWRRTACWAHNVTTGESYQEVVTFHDLCDIAHGTYVAIASQHLFEQYETYLEANLIALETESLAFTVNVFGEASADRANLVNGFLPGNRIHPLAKMVVHKACINDDLMIDLHAWAGDHVIGKIIHHTTNKTERGSDVVYTQQAPIPFHVSGHYILKDCASVTQHRIYPVDTVLHPVQTPSDKPTVFVVMPYIAVGGAEKVALDMMQVLRDEVRFVIISTDQYDHALGTTADAFRQITPYVYTTPDFLHSRLQNAFWHYLIQRFDPQTFYVANGSENIYAALDKIKARFPDLRFANQVYDQRYGWIERYDDALIFVMDANIGCNSSICAAYVARGVPADRSYLIENGIDCAVFDPARYPAERRLALKTNYALPLNTRIVTFMARLHPQKRPMDFVEVARRFENDSSITFLIVGDGPLTAQIDLEILRIGLKNVIRRPFSSGSDILAISDVFVLPSEYEGMPLTILESLALGKPVVVTDAGNNQEVLGVTNGGVLIQHIGDINAIRLGIQEMLDHPPDAGALRQSVLEHYGVERMARQYKDALVGE